MSRLQYRTIADERPQGKPNVYFACHPADFGEYFEEYAARILRIQDCAIWYESEPEADYDREDLELNLSQMQLFVMPVTTKLLTTANRAMDLEFPLAKERHIPVLPIMMERGLDENYSERFGDLQYLDPNDRDETRRSFGEVLETYIKSVLVSSELAEKVRAAFDAYIFLSYRKKDRRKAQDLMRLIHRNPLCRDIAIWYDEFLTPGEDFNQAIRKMLQKSDLFALVVTPNLINEINYVMTTEYPAARKQGKPVLPVEMEETDRSMLEEHYEALPPCVPGKESEVFRAELLKKIRTMAVEANDEEPEHNFLIGLAYLDGIDVEVDAERAFELIKGAAEAGVPEAMEQLIMMYETGKGVARDYYEGVRWREKQVEYLRRAYKSEPTEERAVRLISRLWDLGDAQYALGMLDAAEAAYTEMYTLAELCAGSGENIFLRSLSISYERIGNTARAQGDLAGAQRYYEKSLANAEELAEKTGTIESRRGLSINYERLGDTARAQGDLAGAQRYYEKGFAIDEELAEKTGTIKSKRDLSISYGRLGDTARAKGDLAGAQRYYEKSFAIREELAAKTGTIESKGDLSTSYNKLGDTARAQGDLAGAQRYYEKSLAIREELAEKTGTIESKRDLSISYERLGDTAREQGDLAGAQRYYEKSLAINEELAEKTGTIESRRGLSISYERLGATAIEQGDLAGAQRYYEKSLAIREELAEKTGMLQAHRDLAIILFNMGVFYYNNGISSDRAKSMFERVVEIGKKSGDDYLNELGKEAKDILDNYF